MRSDRLLATLIVASGVACALPGAASAAPQARDPNGANPTDIATPKAADGAIIDKTHKGTPASGASTGAMPPKQGASGSAPGRMRKPTPVSKSASTAM